HGLALVGVSHTLGVSLAGTGAGAAGGNGMLCPGTCSQRYPEGAVVNLLAHPATGSGFAGFTGACTGTGVCRVKLDGDRSLTATFGPPKGTAITAALISKRKRRATFSFAARGAITGFECALQRRRRHH